MHNRLISPPIFNGVRIVNRPDLENVRRLDQGIMPMASSMERTGIRIDPERLVQLNHRLRGDMETLQSKIDAMVGHRLNIASGDQLADLLFKELKLKQNGREKWTKSRQRLSTDGDVLKAMVSQHPVIKPILDWKALEKLRSTYTYSLIAQADENNLIHTDFNHTVAETGRLSSSNPNLQNIPIRTKEGKLVRGAFIPREGNVLGTVDASQIEMRLNAFDSQDAAMLGVFERNEDFYWFTAEGMYRRKFPPEVRKCDCALDPVTGKQKHADACPTIIHAPGEVYDGMTFKKWYRDVCAKITALMVGYDASALGLYDQFMAWGVPGWTEELCAQAIVDYFAVYSGLLKRKKVHIRRAVNFGFVWDLGGRVRWVPQMKSVVPRVRAEGMRQAGNLAGQGGAAFIIKLWMAILWWESGYWMKHGLKFLLQVHDEIVVEGPKPVVEDFLEYACEVLATFMLPYWEWFNVKLGGSSAIGDTGGSWGDLDK